MTRVLLSSKTSHPCPQIKTIALDMKDLTTNGVRILAPGIQHSRILSLSLMGNEEPATATTATASSALPEKMRTQGIVDSKVKEISIYASLGDILALVTMHSITLHSLDLGISKMEMIMTSIRQPPKLQDLVLSGCGLRDEHIRILASGLPSHLCIDKMDFRDNHIGDAGVIALIEYMTSSVTRLVLDHNDVGPIGAQRLIQATSTYANMRLKKLSLVDNVTIGYVGLTKIGDALADSFLTELGLKGVATWEAYNKASPENSTRAETQMVQFKQANRALVTGVRGNLRLHELDRGGGILFEDGVMDEIKFYTDMNQRCGRYLLPMQHLLPSAIWCHLLAKFTNESCVIFAYLWELPMLVPSAE